MGIISLRFHANVSEPMKASNPEDRSELGILSNPNGMSEPSHRNTKSGKERVGDYQEWLTLNLKTGTL